MNDPQNTPCMVCKVVPIVLVVAAVVTAVVLVRRAAKPKTEG